MEQTRIGIKKKTRKADRIRTRRNRDSSETLLGNSYRINTQKTANG